MSEGESIAIKIRVDSGCFHREHSPEAYKIIDELLNTKSIQLSGHEYEFKEHESGPEIIAYAALTTAGITLGKSIIDLVTTIIKARAEGIYKGDKPNAPLKLIVRTQYVKKGIEEKIVMEFNKFSEVDKVAIETNLQKAVVDLNDVRIGKPKEKKRKQL